MKKHFATIAFAAFSLQTATAQRITMTVDTVQLFSYRTELGFEKAFAEDLLYFTGTRVYSEAGKHWTMHKGERYVHFGGKKFSILRYENDIVVYLVDGREYQIFMKQTRLKGRSRNLIVFLEPDINGITRGGYGYPRNVTTTGGQ